MLSVHKPDVDNNNTTTGISENVSETEDNTSYPTELSEDEFHLCDDKEDMLFGMMVSGTSPLKGSAKKVPIKSRKIKYANDNVYDLNPMKQPVNYQYDKYYTQDPSSFIGLNIVLLDTSKRNNRRRSSSKKGSMDAVAESDCESDDGVVDDMSSISNITENNTMKSVPITINIPPAIADTDNENQPKEEEDNDLILL